MIFFSVQSRKLSIIHTAEDSPELEESEWKEVAFSISVESQADASVTSSAVLHHGWLMSGRKTPVLFSSLRPTLSFLSLH